MRDDYTDDETVAPVHETFCIAALLAVIGGFLDAYTYILRGNVFANAQTGNIVLLAVSLAEGRVRMALYYILPIMAFAVGVFITELFKKSFSEREYAAYEHWIVLIEAALLALIGLAPASLPDGVVNVAISFVCSLQVNSFRKMRGLPYASTMCTGNLRSGAEKLFGYIIGHDRDSGIQALNYIGIIGMFAGGAFLGTILSNDWGGKSIWICCVALLAAAAAMRRDRGRSRA